jgi:peptide deformylase
MTEKIDIHDKSRARLLPVTYYGDSQLQEPSVPVADIDEHIRELARDMLATMYKNNGIGLAGPQAGSNIRIVVIDIPGDNNNDETSRAMSPGEQLLLPRMPLVLINPEVMPVTVETSVAEEGCLSFPNIYGEVERATSVMLKSRMLDADPVQVVCGGLLARCLQHELDHLNGVVFVDRMEPAHRNEIDGELKKLRKRTRKQLKRQAIAS